MKNRQNLQKLAMPLALFAICAFFAVKEPAFLGSRNLTQLLIEFAMIGTLSVGMLLVLLTGNIDLSVGSGVGLIGGIAAVLVFRFEWPAFAAMLAGLGVALVAWFAIGWFVVAQRIPSFIITLGGLLVFKGAFWLVISNSTIPVSPGNSDNLYSALTTYYLPDAAGYGVAAIVAAAMALIAWQQSRERRQLGLDKEPGEKAPQQWRYVAGAAAVFGLVAICNGFHGVPLALMILSTVALLIYFLTAHTPFGRYLYAIGGNTEAAVLSGINTFKVTIWAYVILGATVAITGLMTTAYSGASTSTVGELMELDAVAACVIGGTSLRGGRGGVVGVLFGALVMTALLNGMTLMAVSPELKFIARGTILTLAVWLDVALTRASGSQLS
jgi:D-xylose transport system permease protein